MLQDCFDVSWVKKKGHFLSTAKDLLAQTCFWNLRESPTDVRAALWRSGVFENGRFITGGRIIWQLRSSQIRWWSDIIRIVKTAATDLDRYARSRVHGNRVSACEESRQCLSLQIKVRSQRNKTQKNSETLKKKKILSTEFHPIWT